MGNFNIDTLYRMKHNTSSKEYVTGFFVSVILHKDVFTSNEQVSHFLKMVLKLQLLPYATRSRTLMCAKACRTLVASDHNEISAYGASAAFYIQELLNFTENEKRIGNAQKNRKQKNALDNMDRWVTGILNKDK